VTAVASHPPPGGRKHTSCRVRRPRARAARIGSLPGKPGDECKVMIHDSQDYWHGLEPARLNRMLVMMTAGRGIYDGVYDRCRILCSHVC
jgi:hypothetical protein